jgi:hypothetical protein
LIAWRRDPARRSCSKIYRELPRLRLSRKLLRLPGKLLRLLPRKLLRLPGVLQRLPRVLLGLLSRKLLRLRRICRLLVGIRGLLHGLAWESGLPGESRNAGLSWEPRLSRELSREASLSWNKGLAWLRWHSGLSRLIRQLAGLRGVLLDHLIGRRIGIRVAWLAAGGRCRSEPIAWPPQSHVQRVGRLRIGIIGIDGLRGAGDL